MLNRLDVLSSSLISMHSQALLSVTISIQQIHYYLMTIPPPSIARSKFQTISPTLICHCHWVWFLDPRMPPGSSPQKTLKWTNIIAYSPHFSMQCSGFPVSETDFKLAVLWSYYICHSFCTYLPGGIIKDLISKSSTAKHLEKPLSLICSVF